jgi:hypothetical protein
MLWKFVSKHPMTLLHEDVTKLEVGAAGFSQSFVEVLAIAHGAANAAAVSGAMWSQSEDCPICRWRPARGMTRGSWPTSMLALESSRKDGCTGLHRPYSRNQRRRQQARRNGGASRSARQTRLRRCPLSSKEGGGPAGNAIAPPSGGGDGSFGHWYVNNVLDPSSTGNQLGNLPDIGFSSEAGSFVIPLGTIAQIIEEWVSFFEWLFGGGGTPVIPRQLRHNRHPLYPVVLAIRPSETPSEGSEAPTESEPTAPSTPCNPPPLQLIADNTSNGPGDEDWCIKRCTNLVFQRGINAGRGLARRTNQGMPYFRCVNQCMGTGDYPEWRPYFPRHHDTVPDSSSNFQVPKISPWWAVIPLLPALGEAAAAAFGL